jgi:hypothetical protein
MPVGLLSHAIALSRRAAEVGASVPEFLPQEIERMAQRPGVTEWLARTLRRSGVPRSTDVVESLDELRGEWPTRARR